MTKNYDAPSYIDVKETDKKDSQKKIEELKALCQSQTFAVLASHGPNEAYTSLISYSVSDDFKEIVFASPKDTKKINFIQENKNVSLLIDNRDSNPKSINDIFALTVRGRAEILKSDLATYKKQLKTRHPYLKEFIDAETTAIVRIKVSHYYYVGSFQEVFDWTPTEK